MKVLCVEDEVSLREDIVEYLRMHAYEVDEAESGEEAIEHLNQNRYDLVLCDIKMPRMGGYELLRQVRNENHLATTPFLFLSALNERDDKIRAHATGCDGYLTKPIDFSVLDATLKATIERQRTRDFLYSSSYDSAQRHIMAMLDDALSGSMSEACLLIQHMRDHVQHLTPEQTDQYLATLQDKMSAHVSGLHMFHGALVMQATNSELVSDVMLADDLIKFAVDECHYNNPSSEIVYQAPRASGTLVHGDMRLMQRAIAGLMAEIPHARRSNEIVTYDIKYGSCIITLCDTPDMMKETDFTPLTETTNLATFSNVTRHRLVPLSYALQAAQAHHGRLEVLIWPGDKLAVRFVLPQPTAKSVAAA